MAGALTVRQLAQRWLVSERTVQTMAAKREIRALKVRGQWRFSLVDVEAYEQGHTVEAESDPAPATATVSARSRASRRAPAAQMDGPYMAIFPGPVPWRREVVQ